MATTIEWPPRRRKPRRLRYVLAALVVLLLAGGTALSYYVDALWFDSLGFSAVFWKTLNLQGTIFAAFFIATFAVVYGAYALIKPSRLAELATFNGLLVNGQPFTLPVEPALNLIAIGVGLVIAFGAAAGMMAEWPVLALYWYGGTTPGAVASTADPIFGRPLAFYLFTLPAWDLITGWLLTLAIVCCLIAGFFVIVTGGTRLLTRRSRAVDDTVGPWRGLSIAWAAMLLVVAARVYLGRFDRLFEDHTVFSGVTYTDAHVTLAGLLIVAIALAIGAAVALINAVSAPRLQWLIVSILPAAAAYVVTGILTWYTTSFIVKPNELVRETPYIAHNIAMTRQAFALDTISEHQFPADAGVEAMEAADNQATLTNVRLWDWRALQDTLRQIQEIRTYYDFPDIDIDRYHLADGERQVMVAARELNLNKLPESSRNWINERLIYTHGYGVTMNPVNGYTPEGMPTLMLGNMPVQSTVPGLTVTRPEIYFGELTDSDVYVKTRQREFNYPQGETNSFTSYEGSGGIVLGGFFRRMLIALDRGDLAKLPFSDDITADSRLLMRRNVRDRIAAVAPFLTFDPDPFIVVGKDGRLSWIVDGFTTSGTFPFSRHYRLGQDDINYLRNSVKAVVDAYDGSVTLYVFDPNDPIVAGYRRIFPTLFRDASAMPPDLRAHVRYPELLLKAQAAAYGLYHMINPEVFYNREDLWTVASDVSAGATNQDRGEPLEPNFVLMKLPGEKAAEFVVILPFTPSNRNNLIGWIAGRSDGEHYGTATVFDFPKTKLVDGPLQVEARIDQNPQLSSQLTLWNQQGSHVRRGSLLVIPIGRALLYAQPIYLQAERSPMPELRLVVLAQQEKLAFAPTFEAAWASLVGESGTAPAQAPGASAPRQASAPGGAPSPATAVDTNAMIAAAARDLADYQRLTAEGKLGEAGQKLDQLKDKLQRLAR